MHSKVKVAIRTHLLLYSNCVRSVVQFSKPPDMFQLLFVSLVISRLDYGNAVLVGLPV